MKTCFWQQAVLWRTKSSVFNCMYIKYWSLAFISKTAIRNISIHLTILHLFSYIPTQGTWWVHCSASLRTSVDYFLSQLNPRSNLCRNQPLNFTRLMTVYLLNVAYVWACQQNECTTNQMPPLLVWVITQD